MMALQSRETHNITLKNLALFRPTLCDYYSTDQIARFVNCYCYGVNVIEFSIRLKIENTPKGLRFEAVIAS